VTGAVRARATDPYAFDAAVETLDAACRCDSDCAMTGDARAAMTVVARITFRLVLIVDLALASCCPAALLSSCLSPHKTSVPLPIYVRKYNIYGNLMRSVRALVTRFPQIALWSAISHDIAVPQSIFALYLSLGFNGSMQ
jgi:hypothetical protein